MNIGVPSRFACLKIEDEEGASQRSQNGKKNDNSKPKKTENAGGKNGANGASKKTNKQNGTTKKDKKKNVSDKQWEEWKQIDSALVADQYEGDLKSAILLSKLEYEQNKRLQECRDNIIDTKKDNKKKKMKAIPLNQFLNDHGDTNPPETYNGDLKGNEEQFFKDITHQAVQVLNKEKLNAERKEREENIDERITIAQYQDKLEKEKQKNLLLQKDITDLKLELKTVKSRNKALCDMLGHGEMKDKADVLSELERLNSVKNELTDEVSRLHGLLEQERSKVASLSDPKHKDKKNKKH